MNKKQVDEACRTGDRAVTILSNFLNIDQPIPSRVRNECQLKIAETHIHQVKLLSTLHRYASLHGETVPAHIRDEAAYACDKAKQALDNCSKAVHHEYRFLRCTATWYVCTGIILLMHQPIETDSKSKCLAQLEIAAEIASKLGADGKDLQYEIELAVAELLPPISQELCEADTNAIQNAFQTTSLHGDKISCTPTEVARFVAALEGSTHLSLTKVDMETFLKQIREASKIFGSNEEQFDTEYITIAQVQCWWQWANFANCGG